MEIVVLDMEMKSGGFRRADHVECDSKQEMHTTLLQKKLRNGDTWDSILEHTLGT
jgi:hypothetical protein